MAVTKVPGGSIGRIIVETGVDAEGKPVFATRSYSNIRPTATDQAVYDVLSAIGSLQAHSVNKLLRVDQAELADM